MSLRGSGAYSSPQSFVQPARHVLHTGRPTADDLSNPSVVWLLPMRLKGKIKLLLAQFTERLVGRSSSTHNTRLPLFIFGLFVPVLSSKILGRLFQSRP